MDKPESSFKAFEHNGWLQSAAQYDIAFQRLTAQSIVPLLDAVQVRSGTQLLDLASGPGYVAAAAAERGAQAVAIDFSETMVALGRARHPHIKYCIGDVEAVDLPECSVDAAVMAYGLLHLARPDQAMAEAWRILRPGGHFSATVWAQPARAVGFAIILDAIRAYGRIDVPLPSGPPFFRFSDHAEFHRSLEAVGFQAVQVLEIPQVWWLRDADEFFTAMRYGTVRTGALLAAQSPTDLAAISTAVAIACEAYRSENGILLPMPAVLGMGMHPIARHSL